VIKKTSLIVVVLMILATHQLFAADARSVLKDGVVGAAAGGIGASVGKGDATKGALVGAGVGIAGNVLFDVLAGPKQPAVTNVQPSNTREVVYVEKEPEVRYVERESRGRKRGHKKRMDKAYDDGYTKGFKDGLKEGQQAAADDAYDEGFQDGVQRGYNSAHKEVSEFCEKKLLR